MAIITYPSRPNDVHQAHKAGIYIYSDITNISEPKFRYVNRLYDSLGTELAKWKQFPNPDGRCVFDVSELVRGTMNFDNEANGAPKAIHSPSTHLTTGTNSCKRYKVTTTQEWAATIDDEPTEQGDVAEHEFLMLYGSFQYIDGRSFNWEQYKINDIDVGDFITNSPRIIDIEEGQEHLLACLNNDSAPLTLDSSPSELEVRYYDENDSLIHSFTFQNINGEGGEPSGTADNGECLLFAGVGMKNLEDVAAIADRPSSQVELSYYLVRWIDTSVGIDPQSEVFRFNVVSGDCKFNTYRIAFVNSLGTWDYFNFTKRADEKLEVSREEFNKLDRIYKSNDYTFRPYEGGSTIYSQEVKRKLSVSSDWISEATAEWLQELLQSPIVHVWEDSLWKSAKVTNSSFDVLKKVNKSLFNIQLDLEFANNTTNALL